MPVAGVVTVVADTVTVRMDIIVPIAMMTLIATIANRTCGASRAANFSAQWGGEPKPTMLILVDLVKAGTIGASLAFLILAYRLLAREQARPQAARPNMLLEIRRFRGGALIFLVVGILSEFFLTHGLDLLAAAYQLIYRDPLVRVRFTEWGYHPDKQSVGFAFEEHHSDPRFYVLPALRDQYDVYVGLRAEGASPAGQGVYKVVFGPYHIGNQPRVNAPLTTDQLALLGDGCIELAAFGVPKSGTVSPPIDLSHFEPGVIVFNWATVCR